MEDLISVIVPIYNVEKYLNKCIDSIINQKYKNLEIILVDDGSPDNSGKICDEYSKKDNRIKVIHKENGGVSSARNVGINNATGNWISFIDSDDWIEEDYINNLLSNAKKNNAEISMCGYNRVYETKVEKINANGDIKVFNSREFLIKALNPQTGIGFSHMKLIKRQAISDLHFNDDMKVAEDAFFNIKLSKNINKACFIGEALYNYRNNQTSIVKSFKSDYAQMYLYSMKICREYIFEEYNDQEILQNYYNFVAYHVLLVANNYCYHQDNNQKNKIRLLKEICNYEIYKEGIEKSNYCNISLTRKITLFTLKHKLYFITGMICRYRHFQQHKIK